MNLCDVKTVVNIMRAYGLKAQKGLGQNFLTDFSVVSDIADSCAADPDETILEIGPGMGVLTRELAARYKKVIALEIDENLIPVLNYTLSDFKNVTVVNGDIMKTDLRELLSDAFAEGGVSVCANLPYYITSPILMKLLESELPFNSITVMVQKEVAERLAAGEGSRNSGAVTLAVAYRGRAEMLMTVPSDRFIPEPKVDSAVVKIDLYKKRPVVPKDEKLMFSLIRAAFNQRRKTLANALSASFSEFSKDEIAKFIEEAGFSADIRGEKLTVADFAKLSDIISVTKLS